MNVCMYVITYVCTYACIHTCVHVCVCTKDMCLCVCCRIQPTTFGEPSGQAVRLEQALLSATKADSGVWTMECGGGGGGGFNLLPSLE